MKVALNTKTELKAIAIGIIAGIRSMSAPALTSIYIARNGNLIGSRLDVLASTAASKALKLLAEGEMVADKLPIVPARISAAPLIIRAASGTISGAAVCAADKSRTDLERYWAGRGGYWSNGVLSPAVLGGGKD